MTIASEITDLQNNLAAAKNAVTAKGGTVGNTGLAGLASEIAGIPSGGGGTFTQAIFSEILAHAEDTVYIPSSIDYTKFLQVTNLGDYIQTLSYLVLVFGQYSGSNSQWQNMEDGTLYTTAELSSILGIELPANYTPVDGDEMEFLYFGNSCYVPDVPSV